ncbi:hypothetical protein OIU78_018085 [Salix suchowensis]|nr:hypothetical protein OIU78_018085 [Salix suchowensis]
MDVQAPPKLFPQNFNDDDDDGPIVFKRGGNSMSKQNQLNPEAKKPSSSSQNSNGQILNLQKGKLPIPSSNASPVKTSIGSFKASASSPKMSPLKSTLTYTRAPTSSNDQSKQASKQVVSNAVKEETKQILDDEDSEDDKPLSSRLKGSTNNAIKGVTASACVKDEPSDDDEVPLSSRFAMKSNAGTSSSKTVRSSEIRPLPSKSQLNGSTKNDKQQKSSVVLTKRPMDSKVPSNHSSAKKPKLLVACTTTKVKQVTVKDEQKADDDDHLTISQRMKKANSSATKSSFVKKKVTKVISSSFKKTTQKNKTQMKNSKYSKSTKVQPGSSDGQKKWTTLIHNGVIFPPPYKPHGVKILYKGKPVDLTPEQEEVATMFAVMKDTDYVQKPQFLQNFWNDWRKLLGKNHVIQKLEDCDFNPIYEWHQQEKEKKKQMSTEEKKVLKEDKLKQEEKYMWAIVNGVKEKVGNFRVEPPGLFRGRGEHPKMGKLKSRIHPSDITINIGKDAPIPECPIPGERWKEVKHDNTVTWLAFWNDPINPKEFKYVFLAASSSLKGQSDKEKYEKARKLKDYIHNIRAAYTKDFASKDITKRQIAVATYLIDKLALRAGNEKDDDEADTVGCCTLKVANVECIPPNKLKFDFLGKDSIRYENTVEVELPVYKAIGHFQVGKKQTDDLFHSLDTSKLNAHLKELMPGLTAKVFRTYNASITLDEKLYEETEDGDIAEKTVIYNQANKQVAIICNHQRTISKSHDAQMSRLTEKIEELKGTLKELNTDLDRAKKGKPPLKDADGKQKRNLTPEAITVAWCKRHEVPIDKIFNKSLLAKFTWAMDVDPQFRF